MERAQYKCEVCRDTGYYGDNGPGINRNKEYVPCDEPIHNRASDSVTPVMRSLPHDSQSWENWIDGTLWAEIADAFYQCSAKGETIKELGKKYLIVVRQ